MLFETVHGLNQKWKTFCICDIMNTTLPSYICSHASYEFSNTLLVFYDSMFDKLDKMNILSR